MSLDGTQKQALKATLGKCSRAQLKTLFALVRAHDDRALLAAFTPPRPKRRKAASSLARDIERALKPVMGPAGEKADMLIEFMAKKHRRKLAGGARGFSDAAKRLKAHFSDDQIRAAAAGLMTKLAKLYGERETVA